MYDPCARCNCVLHQDTCRKFCTAYKAAVQHDTHIGMVEFFRAQHDRIVRAQK